MQRRRLTKRQRRRPALETRVRMLEPWLTLVVAPPAQLAQSVRCLLCWVSHSCGRGRSFGASSDNRRGTTRPPGEGPAVSFFGDRLKNRPCALSDDVYDTLTALEQRSTLISKPNLDKY